MRNKLEKVRLADVGLDDTTFMSRLDFNEGSIKALAEDIHRSGQRNPIGLREKEGRLHWANTINDKGTISEALEEA